MPSKWDLAHPDKTREYKRQWRRRNKQARLDGQRRLRARNPMQALVYRDKYKETKNAQARKRRAENKTKLLALLGNKCVKCEFSDPRALQIDHIDGKGYLVRNTVKQTASYYLRAAQNNLPEFLKNHQLLCASCNQIKKFENGEHLHGPMSKKQNVIPRPQAA